MRSLYDIAIVGSGFAGSLLAMIATRIGRSVLLIEKGSHPRFAIGESTTPLGNLLLAEIAENYNLPRLAPLTKWGTWQSSCPHLACGLKRGFTFYSREEELLVAASASDATSDTHWYRPDLDSFLVNEAQDLGVDYFDQVTLHEIVEDPDSLTLMGSRRGAPLTFRAKFLIDASGPRGFLHRALNLDESQLPGYPPTEALYSHFSNVRLFDNRNAGIPPYPPNHAALHHVFDGGWIWVLRFNNGLTSAGVAATKPVAERFQFAQGSPAWDRLLDSLPAVKQQFHAACPQVPFVHSPQLSFLSSRIAGSRWALLPSAAAFVDPLLSTGVPLTLFGVTRLAAIIDRDWNTTRFTGQLECYAARTKREALATATLIGALYSAMGNFPLFVSLSMLYFVAASFSESARRRNQPQLADSFLLCDDPVFGPACASLCGKARSIKPGKESAAFNAELLRAIEPFNFADFGNPEYRNWYPVDTDPTY